MNSFHKPQIVAFSAFFGLCILTLPVRAGAFSRDGEAVLEFLRERIAAGGPGQESYQAMLTILSEDPAGTCEDWTDAEPPAEARDGALTDALAAVCPLAVPVPGDGAGRGVGQGGGSREDFRGRLSASQAVQPRRDAASFSRARLDASATIPGGAGAASWRGDALGRRRIRIVSPRLALDAGHLGPSLADTRVACVAGARFYAGGAGTSGIEGPLASGYSGLDGVGLSARAGAWKLQAAGAWNRLPDLGNPAVTTPPDGSRRDAGLFTAGLARGEIGAGAGRPGAGMRAQAMVARLDPGGGASLWLPVAGGELSLRSGAYAFTAAGAGSWYRRGAGAYGELNLAAREPVGDSGREAWRVSLHQAGAGWANPLQAPRGRLRDTLDGRWIVTGAGEGGAGAEAAFPIACGTSWRSEAGGGFQSAWAENGLLETAGHAVWVHSWGAWKATTGGALGWRRTGIIGAPTGGWGHSLEWRRGPWRLGAACSRQREDYAGSRPFPFSLSCSRKSRVGPFSLAWSTGDVEHPRAYQILEGGQSWSVGGNGIRVEQRLRVPWTQAGVAGDMGYQLALAAEF